MKFCILIILCMVLPFITGCKKDEAGASESNDLICVRHIQIDSKEKAEEILKELKEGKEPFEKLAGKYSKCPSKVNGGKLEPFGKGTKDKNFEEVAFKLKINEISGPVETELGWEIIERLPPPPPTPTPVPPTPSPVRIRHILVEKKEEADEVIKELKEGKDFTELAIDKSACPSRKNGGDLGTLNYNGNLSGPVKEVAFKLKMNEISEPIKSEYGFHVIQRIEPALKIEVHEREKIRIRHIVVEEEEEAKEILKELKEGKDFSEAALEKSLCPSRQNGGDLGMVSTGTLTRSLESVAFKLKINEFCEPVKSEYGWHIMQRISPALVIKMPPLEIKVSHILVNTQEEANKIKEELKKSGDFITIAKEKSQCSTKSKGGNLGKIKRGDMAAPFEKAAFSLDVGGISEPVHLTDGWHIIKRTE